jgi:hypothetical protein
MSSAGLDAEIEEGSQSETHLSEVNYYY